MDWSTELRSTFTRSPETLKSTTGIPKFIDTSTDIYILHNTTIHPSFTYLSGVKVVSIHGRGGAKSLEIVRPVLQQPRGRCGKV